MSELMASLLTTVLAEVLPGVLFVRWVQRKFEDLLAVLIFSPVRWGWMVAFFRKRSSDFVDDFGFRRKT